ncbi:alpha/beta fold hydrolase, partial [Streptomyces sp. NRRL F-6677]|uniref:alpha/beta fold hydrolase n=2 Tax=Streptomyces TaxID=1883 RepID=UPI001F45ABFA
MADTGRILTGVINRVAGDSPVVLAGHSLGGLIAARYAPDHRDKVKGLVLMDATSSTTSADVTRVIPESATGDAGDLRAQTVAVMPEPGEPRRPRRQGPLGGVDPDAGHPARSAVSVGVPDVRSAVGGGLDEGPVRVDGGLGPFGDPQGGGQRSLHLRRPQGHRR